jgi:hypothetical protein
MLIDTFLGILGLGVSFFAIIDNRHQRSAREKAVIAAHAVIERTYGLLIGLKPSVETLPNVQTAINDGLSAVNKERDNLAAL